MRTIFRWIANLYSGPLQAPLVFAFTAVAAITVGVGIWVISSTINNYLATTMDERVARDIRLANSYYELRLNEVAGVVNRLAGNSTILSTLESVDMDESLDLESTQQEILREANGAMLNGNLFVGILDVMMDSILDGLSTSRNLSQEPNTADIPIIMATSIASTSYAEYFPTDEYIHVRAFLSKPVRPADLVRQVNRFLPKS